jgi:two-component system KDP operon response regulator KdpE
MKNNRRTTILTVDDEPRYLRAIKVNLEASGYRVILAGNGQSAIELAAAKNIGLILMDVDMPGMDGYEACRRIREFSCVPIILLTTLAETNDPIRSLDTGAQAAIVKPFKSEELLARIHAILRPAQAQQPIARPVDILTDDLSIDLERGRVRSRERMVDLTRTEFEVLALMAREPGKVMLPEYLLEKVWGADYRQDTRLLWQIIHRLRHKIEADPHRPQYIQTRTGLGYVFIINQAIARQPEPAAG